MAMHKGKDELLRSFMARFNKLLVGVTDLIVPLVVTALLKGLKD